MLSLHPRLAYNSDSHGCGGKYPHRSMKNPEIDFLVEYNNQSMLEPIICPILKRSAMNAIVATRQRSLTML